MKALSQMFLCLVILCSFLTTGTAEDKTEEQKSELEGKWQLTYMEIGGREVELKPGTLLIVTADRFDITSGDTTLGAGTFTLIPDTQPKAVDITYTAGPDQGKTFKCIYRISKKGNNHVFCRPETPESDRPTRFKTEPGSTATLTRFKRVKEVE